MKVRGKKIIVTGGGSGIGRALVLHLLKKGAHVIALDINQEALEETKKLAGQNTDNVSTYVLDITDKQVVEALPDKVGEIDGLINNAGIIQPFVRVNDLKYEAIDRVMKVNFYGMLYMTKTFLPHLLKRPEAHIINVSSMGGFLPVPGQSVYGASKAAVKLLTEGLSSELASTNVHVSVVFPGATQTNITTNSGVKGPQMPADSKSQNIPMLSARVAAKIILDGVEKNKTRILVGKDSKIMNYLYRLSPSFATNLITKQMKSLLPE